MNTRAIPKAYVEHVAIWVRDIHWHIKFFHESRDNLVSTRVAFVRAAAIRYPLNSSHVDAR